MTLFISKKFTSHSGVDLDWKIECDNFTEEDIKTICDEIISNWLFTKVIGIPTGGTKFEKYLKNYETKSRSKILLIVDDVATTCSSLINEYNKNVNKYDDIIAIPIFSRCDRIPEWCYPMFQLWYR